MSVALFGGVAERLRDAVAFMHASRRRVETVRERITRREAPEITRRYRNAEMRDPTRSELAVLLDRIISDHPDFRSAVADEQWGGRLTQTYALLRAAEQRDEIIALLRSVDARLARMELVEVPEVSPPPG